MKLFPAFITSRSYRLGKLINPPVAFGERFIDMLNSQMFEFPRFVFWGFGNLYKRYHSA
jgi:hypothetical protein